MAMIARRAVTIAVAPAGSTLRQVASFAAIGVVSTAA